MIRSNIPFDDSHVFRMTDDTGMFQHTRFSVPDLSKGYTTDDNARALIMAVMLYEQEHKKKYLVLIYRYLAFVMFSQNGKGRFRNFMTYDRQFIETEGSEDCFGRCLWALGYVLASPAMPEGVKNACVSTVRRALRNNPLTLNCIRGQAYTIIGLGFADNDEANTIISELAILVADSFEKCAGETDWHWFENKLTYDNALLPWAMFIAYRRTNQRRYLDIAQSSLAFLDRQAFRDGFFRPVGCNGWWVRGTEPALYDQQPVEASMSTLAHLAAFSITGEKKLLDLAKKSFAWYFGQNSLGESLIDQNTGGCFDGITPYGVNRNQGAESIVGYGIAKLSLEKYKISEAVATKTQEGRKK